MTREEIHQKLEEIKNALHEEFAEHHASRLAQLDSHVATVGMVVDNIHLAEASRTGEGN